MRILITGGEGFVGSHLAAALGDHEVVTADQVDADLATPYVHEHLIGAVRPDYVVHLGARYGRILCAEEPHRSVCENAAGTTEIAMACAQHDIPVLYASSSEVYGDHGTETITEESELRMPTTIYGLSKRWGEEALSLYMPPEKLCVVRMNMLYGPRQRSGHGCCALAQFIAKALRGEPFTVHRDTSRSWLYISDAVEALKRLIEEDQHGVFNLGNCWERLKMTDVAELVTAETGGTYRIEDPPPSQIRHKVYSVTKLEEAIGWRPSVALAEGIRQTVQSEREEALVG